VPIPACRGSTNQPFESARLVILFTSVKNNGHTVISENRIVCVDARTSSLSFFSLAEINSI